MISGALDSSLWPPRMVVLLTLLTVLAFGCGDDEAGTGGTGGAGTAGTGGSGAGGTGGPGATPAPIFAISGQLFTPATGEFIAWLKLVPELRPDLELPPEEFFAPGGSGTWVARGDGTLYFLEGDSGVIERFRADDDLTIESEGRLSFLNFGVDRAGSHELFFLTDTKAYFLDRFLGQIIVWNPSTFEIESSFLLEGLERDGLRINIAGLQLRDDQLIVVARYSRPSDGDFEPLVVAAFIDTVTDEVTYAEDTRCGNAGGVSLTPEGDLYLASFVNSSSRFFLGQSGDPPVEPCAIRIRAGETDFDSDYFLDIGELAGTELAWGPLQGGSGRGYFVIYDPEVVPIPDDLDGVSDQDLTNTPAWVLYSAVLGDEEATLARVSGLDPSGGIVLNSVYSPRNGEPRVLLSQFAADFSSTTLVDVTDPESVEVFLAEAPGIFTRVQQAR